MKKLIAAVVALAIVPASAQAATQTERWGTYIGGTEGGQFTQTSPFAVSGLESIVAVDASNSSSYALTSSGIVMAWGNGERGQLGNGQLSNSFTKPVPVSIPEPVVAIGEAKNEGMAIGASGQAWVWGEDGSASLCFRSWTRVNPTPRAIPGLTATAVQGGEEHTLWLQANGTVLGCGSNSVGQEGQPEEINVVRTPTLIPGLSHVVEISAGSRTSEALTSTGQVYAFGDNVMGAVGVGSTAPAIYSATHVSLPEAAKAIADGGDLRDNGSMLALGVSGQLYAWGDDQRAQLGDGGFENEFTPVATGLTYTAIATGGVDSFGLDSKGNLYGWGSTAGGSLGVGQPCGIFTTPVLVQTGVTEVSATAYNVEAVH